MGQRSRILLVAAAFLAGLGGCGAPDQPAESGRTAVEASDYDAFFLWAGVEPSAALDNAKSVYILSGEVRCRPDKRFESLRGEPNLGDDTDVWLVVRADCLEWDQALYQRVFSDLNRWSRQNRVVGLQIDYDSPTGELSGYARFLSSLRARLPQEYQLSVTGLLDWSSQGDPASLAALDSAVDEIVVQTYRGRKTVADYQSYVRSFADLPLPYKIGLVQHGEWAAPTGLETDPEFLGYVVFLVND